MIDVFQVARRGKDSQSVAMLQGLPDINLRNDNGQSLLHAAIAYGNEIAADALINGGINVNTQDKDGLTPLHYCAPHKLFAVAEQLLRSGADMDLFDRQGNSVLWTAVFNARGDHTLVSMLALYGAKRLDLVKNVHGLSPVDFAKQIGDAEMVRIILEGPE